MKASEIVDKLKSVLLSAEDTQAEVAEEQVELSVEEVEVNEPVELAEDGEMPAEEPSVEVEVEYATKEDLAKAIAEMKAMIDALAEGLGSEEMEIEVPSEELSKEEEPAKEELSSQEPGAEPIAHTPEVEASAPQFQSFASKRPRGTMDTVYAKMFNK